MLIKGCPWMPRQWQQEDFSTIRTMCCCKVLTCEQVVVPGFCPAVLETWHGHSYLTFELLECQSSYGWFPLSAPGLKPYLSSSRLTFSRMLPNNCTMVKALNSSLMLGKLLLTQTFPSVLWRLHCFCPYPRILGFSPWFTAKRLLASREEAFINL